MDKLVFNISDAPTWTKVLPLVGAGAGLALAKYQKKECVFCYVAYGLIGLIGASVPMLVKSKES